MHVHFVAVAGTGMGSLAGLFKAAGHDVSGSDVAFYPPMGPALRAWGIHLHEGFDPAHLEPRPDLVIIGNVCRPWNPEARAAVDAGIPVASMAGALADQVLRRTRPLVVAGTHGKTTTSALCAWLLEQAGRHPGFLIGGLPKNFPESFRMPGTGTLPPAGSSPPSGREPGAAAERNVLPFPAPPFPAPPFVVEGDEYDTAFFEKTPKFWHYRAEVAILTSIEQDHVDIYPDESTYRAAFRGFVERVAPDGLIVAHAADREVVELCRASARAELAWYALEGDDWHGCSPHWLGARAPGPDGGTAFDLYAGGSLLGRVRLRVPGEHNVRNALAALAAGCQGYGVSWPDAARALGSFEGVRRRQDLIGEVRGVRVYDDFAHHPTAVRETLSALRARHPGGALFAVYEPRSATACRALHQAQYPAAFRAADRVVLAPVGRPDIPATERLDLAALAAELRRTGTVTDLPGSLDEIVALLAAQAQPGDTVVLLSNGSFGGIHERLLAALGAEA